PLAATYTLSLLDALPILGVFTLVALAVMFRIRNVALKPWKAFRQASADLFGFLEERIGGTEDIRASGAIPYVMRRFYGYARQRIDRKSTRLNSSHLGISY